MSISAVNAEYLARISTAPLPDSGAPDWCDACTLSPCQCPPAAETATEAVPRRRGSLVDLSTVPFERPEWVKRGWYPAKVATMISGRGGTGKSSLTLADIAAGSRGELHGRSYGKPLRTILVTVEDSKGMQKVRLRAAGADLNYVRLFEVEDTDGNPDVIPAIPGDLPELERVAREFGADMIVVDPLSSMVHGDMNKVETIRRALDPLAKLARSLNIAVVIVHHHKKGGGTGNDLASGSHSIRDAIRSSLLVAHDPETGERVITFDKSNYSKLEGTSLAFDLISVPMLDDDEQPVFDEEGTQETVAVAVVTGPSSTSVESIANRAPSGENDEEDRNAAQAFLLDLLRENNLEIPAKDALKAGAAAGFSADEMKKARSRSRDPKIRSRKSTFGSGWVWAIDTEDATEGARSQGVAPSAPSAPWEEEVAPSGTVPYSSPAPQGATETLEGAQGAQDATLTIPGTFGGTFATEPEPLVCIMCERPADAGNAFCTDHTGLVTA